MIQAQLDAARRTAERERAATVVVKRSLDEARAEIKMLQEKDTVGIDGGIGGDQAEKLKNLEMQSTLLRESNQLLRAETLKLEASLKTSQFELDETKAKLEPLEKSQRDSEVEKLALEAEKDSLKRDLETWKGRLQSMVSKFNTVSTMMFGNPCFMESVLKNSILDRSRRA
jgi:FtsZ-binding cell division protein ZapB